MKILDFRQCLEEKNKIKGFYFSLIYLLSCLIIFYCSVPVCSGLTCTCKETSFSDSTLSYVYQYLSQQKTDQTTENYERILELTNSQFLKELTNKLTCKLGL